MKRMLRNIGFGLVGLVLAGALSGNALGQEKDKNHNCRVFAEYTAGFEGRRNIVYDPNPKDNKKEPTIGIGHFLDRGDSREVFARVLPRVDFDAVYNGKAKLTDKEVDALFADDLQAYVDRARKLIPNFDNFPVYFQAALVDMAFRGDLGDSPRTRDLINNGRVREAADEYINRVEYRNAIRNGMAGLKKRMDSNRSKMLRYASELEGN